MTSSLMPGVAVHCQDCGHEFPQDPPFDVRCSTLG
jgi:hypothetical protein